MKLQLSSGLSPMKKTLLAISFVGASLLSNVRAVQVDSELVLLVDVSGSINRNEHNRMMEGIAQSFESGVVLDSIAEGDLGKIAASLVFWSGANRQQVGVAWMEISDASSASQFADAVRRSFRPFRGGSAVGSAISYAAGFFGTETGGGNNGFESAHQAITLFADGPDNRTPPRGDRAANVRDATQGAYDSGVDIISAVVVNHNRLDLEQYYTDNLVDVGNNPNASVTMVGLNAASQGALDGGIESVLDPSSRLTVVPEPSVLCSLFLGSLTILCRRKRS